MTFGAAFILGLFWSMWAAAFLAFLGCGCGPCCWSVFYQIRNS